MKNSAPLSPKQYIKIKARSLPIWKCIINDNWLEGKMATIAILRKHKSGNVTCGIYLVDLFSRGIKDTFFKFNEPENEVMERFLEPYYVEIQYNLAHNIIFGAYAFAKDFGFKAHPHFNEITQYLLEEDTEDIPLIEVEFGIDGKPLLFDVGAD